MFPDFAAEIKHGRIPAFLHNNLLKFCFYYQFFVFAVIRHASTNDLESEVCVVESKYKMKFFFKIRSINILNYVLNGNIKILDLKI